MRMRCRDAALVVLLSSAAAWAEQASPGCAESSPEWAGASAARKKEILHECEAKAAPPADAPAAAAAAGVPAPNEVSAAGEAFKSRVVLVQPLPWIFGVYSGSYEVALNEKWSLAVGVNVTAAVLNTSSGDASQGTNSSSTLSVLGIGVQPGVSYFLTGRAPAGLWVGAKLELQYLNLTSGGSFGSGLPGGGTTTTSSTTTDGFLYGGQAMIGYTYIFSSGFTLQGGVGFGADGSSLNSSSTTSGTGTSGSSPFTILASFGRVSLGAGWAF